MTADGRYRTPGKGGQIQTGNMLCRQDEYENSGAISVNPGGGTGSSGEERNSL